MERLTSLRKLRGLSQRALAKKSGTSPATIHELENGRREPHPSTLRKIAAALEVAVPDLLEDDPAAWLHSRCGHSLLALHPDDVEGLVRGARGDENMDALKAEYAAIFDKMAGMPKPLIIELDPSSKYVRAMLAYIGQKNVEGRANEAVKQLLAVEGAA